MAEQVNVKNIGLRGVTVADTKISFIQQRLNIAKNVNISQFNLTNLNEIKLWKLPDIVLCQGFFTIKV